MTVPVHLNGEDHTYNLRARIASFGDGDPILQVLPIHGHEVYILRGGKRVEGRATLNNVLRTILTDIEALHCRSLQAGDRVRHASAWQMSGVVTSINYPSAAYLAVEWDGAKDRQYVLKIDVRRV